MLGYSMTSQSSLLCLRMGAVMALTVWLGRVCMKLSLLNEGAMFCTPDRIAVS